MSPKKKHSHTVYRDHDTGQIVSKSEGKKRPDRTTKEQMPDPGHGDTGRSGSSKRKRKGKKS